MGTENKEKFQNMSEHTEEYTFTCLSFCHKCEQQIKVEYNNRHFETKENVTFLGRLGSEIYTYCPYCGVKQARFQSYNVHQEIDLFSEDDNAEELDDEDPWWPDAEGATLIAEEENDNNSEETEDESAKRSFICSSCGETFRLNPKRHDKIYCYYCGKEMK